MRSGALVIGAAAAALLVLAFGAKGKAPSKTPHERVSGLPSSGGYEWRMTANGLDRFVHGHRPQSSAEQLAFNAWQAQEFKSRQALLPRDRTPSGGNFFAAGDQYSKEAYWIVPYVDQNTNTAPILIDEFGRTYPGHYEAHGPSGLLETVALTFSNPLFQVVLAGGAVALGPEGLAAYGAYQAWQHRGEGLTAKSALLLAARAYAVSQCGPACGVAFDVGVGVASGKKIDRALEDSLVGNMTPAQRVAYENGRKALKEAA